MRRDHTAVLTECNRLLSDLLSKEKTWLGVVAVLKKASLHHEGDDEAKVNRLVGGHSNRVRAKDQFNARSQPSVAAPVADGAADQLVRAASQPSFPPTR